MGNIDIHISQGQMELAEWDEDALRIEIATHLYRIGAISLGKAREIAVLTLDEFWQEMAKRNLDLNYTVEDLHEDMKAVEWLSKQPVA